MNGSGLYHKFMRFTTMNDTITPGMVIAGVALIIVVGGGVFGVVAFLATVLWVSLSFTNEEE